jgi:hypothetical protein
MTSGAAPRVPSQKNPTSAYYSNAKARNERKILAPLRARSKKSADTSPSQSEKSTGATSKRSNKGEPFKEAIQMELELE